jgi:hypothetical protein
MLGGKAAKLIIALVTVLGTSAGFIFAFTGSAAAATWSCSGTKYSTGRVCTAHTFTGAPLFKSNGSYYTTLPPNDSVTVTCWYAGNSPGYTADGFEDHVTHENISNPPSITGHIPDAYVNFGGNTPNNSTVALHQCS